MRHIAIDIGIDVGHVIAGNQILQPHHIERFERLCQPDRVRHRPTGAAIEREADFIAEDFLHRFHAGDHLLHAAFGERGRDRDCREKRLPAGSRSRNPASRGAIGLWKPMPCLMIVKPSLCGLHLRHIRGEIGRSVARHREAHGAIVDPHPVAHLAAEQFVDRQSRRLPGNVPQRHLNRAHGAPPRLEGARDDEF